MAGPEAFTPGTNTSVTNEPKTVTNSNAISESNNSTDGSGMELEQSQKEESQKQSKSSHLIFNDVDINSMERVKRKLFFQHDGKYVQSLCTAIKEENKTGLYWLCCIGSCLPQQTTIFVMYLLISRKLLFDKIFHVTCLTADNSHEV